jgi:septum formation protein
MLVSLVDNYENIDFILGSASPRRSELLKNIGLKFRVVASEVKEDVINPQTLTESLIGNASKKGKTVAGSYPESLVISADTVVVVDEHILGKPSDKDEARMMLEKLSGCTHEVMTAFGLILSKIEKSYYEVVSTKVRFRQLSHDEISAYVNTGEPLDKAGAYAIQGYGALLIDSIEGCYFNVVGFPLSRFYTALMRFCKQIQV